MCVCEREGGREGESCTATSTVLNRERKREGESCTAVLTILKRERKGEGEREKERGRELYCCIDNIE